MKKLIILFVIAIFICFGCGINREEHEKALNLNKAQATEIDKLKNEINDLKKQIDELKYGAERLLKKAKNSYDEKNYEDAKKSLQELIKRHPQSDEGKQGKILLVKVESAINRILEEKDRAKKIRLANATKNLRKSFDKIEGITWYHDKYSSGTYADRIFLYMGQRKGGHPWIRLRLRYYGDSWIFINKYVIQIDGENFTIIPPKQPDHEVGSGSVWETSDLTFETTYKAIIMKLAKAKSATLRFSGSKGIKDHKVTRNEIRGINDILDTFEALGGKL